MYKRYLLLVLSCLLGLNGVDRLALGLMLQNIKISLDLNDVQLGILNGIAFAAFYSVMGIPMGRWSDRGDRVKIIGTTTALWSVMVSLMPAAASFGQLLLIRIGVAVGESGCVPPSHSLIAENFARAERPRATGIYYTVSLALSTGTGYLLGGWLNQTVGWRATFFLLGIPGVALSIITWTTLREPRRQAADFRWRVSQSASNELADTLSHAPLRAVARLLWRNRTFRFLLLAYSVACFFGYGILQWQPSFFVRSYGFHTASLGFWLAIIYGIGGAVGTYVGGDLASRLWKNDERRQLAAMAMLYSAFGVSSALMYLAANYIVAFALMTVGMFAGAMVTGPLFATVHAIVPPGARAISISLIYLAGNLIGLGLGPLIVGVLSDLLRPRFEVESLRYALLAMCPGYLLASWYIWQASKTVLSDLARVCDLQRPILLLARP